jgi:hypothetical protein
VHLGKVAAGLDGSRTEGHDRTLVEARGADARRRGWQIALDALAGLAEVEVEAGAAEEEAAATFAVFKF